MSYISDLKQKIDILNIKRKSLYRELKMLDKEICILEKEYNISQIKLNFMKGICNSCHDNLTIHDIKYKIIYCQECRENDSVLDFNSRLPTN